MIQNRVLLYSTSLNTNNPFFLKINVSSLLCNRTAYFLIMWALNDIFNLLNSSNINQISADPETGYQGNCGNTMVAIAYLLTYLVISFLIVINMYIAVILENYSQATEDVTVI